MPDDDDRRRRPPSSTERDLESERARRDRASGHQRVVERIDPPAFIHEEITGQYADEDLAHLRAQRPVDERIARLEVKADAAANSHDDLRGDVKKLSTKVQNLADQVADVRAEVADVGGQLKILPNLITTMRDATNALQHREHVTFQARVDVDREQEKSKIHVREAEVLDVISQRKVRRKRITLFIGGVISLVTSGTVLGWLFTR